MFEMAVCSLTLPCEPLMRNPGVFKRQWCVAEVATPRSPVKTIRPKNDTDDTSNEDDVDMPPLILIEACFECMSFRDISTRNIGIESREIDGGDDLASIDATSSIPQDDDTLSLFESTASCASSPIRNVLPNIPTSTAGKRLTSKAHMLRIMSIWRPIKCSGKQWSMDMCNINGNHRSRSSYFHRVCHRMVTSDFMYTDLRNIFNLFNFRF